MVSVLTELLFADVAGLRVERVWRDEGHLHLAVVPTSRAARCPCCRHRSRRVRQRVLQIV